MHLMGIVNKVPIKLQDACIFHEFMGTELLA